MRFQLWQAALLVLLMAALLPFLAWNGLVQDGNLAVYDWLLRLRRPTASTAIPEIVLLAVDDATVGRNGQLPLRRNLLAAGLVRLLAEPPKVLAVALTFPEETSKEADQMLGRVLAQFPGLVLGVEQDLSEENAPWVLPIPALRAPNTRLGNLHLSPDPDGVVRAVELLQGDEEQRYWSLAVQAALLSQGGEAEIREVGDRLEIGAVTVPARAAESYRIWIRHAGPVGTFRTFSFLRLLDGTLDPHTVAGKIVILGMTASGVGPEFETPFAKTVPMTEIEVQANILRALLEGDILRPLEVAWEYALLLAVATAVIVMAWWRQGRGLLWAVAAGLPVLPLGVFVALAFGWVLPLVSLSVSFYTTSLLALAALRFTSPALPRRS